MQRRIRRGLAATWPLCVAAAAVSLAMGVLLGFFVTPRTTEVPIPVFATATHGQESYAICTGELEDGIDAIFFLDYLTGDLRATSLNLRTHHFQTFYHRNIMNDLGAQAIKNPRFLMVTGVADLQRNGRNERFGRAVVYVAEINSGQCVAYAVPSVAAQTALGFQAAAPLIPVDRVDFRTVKIRQ